MLPLTVSLKLYEKRQLMGRRRYQRGSVELVKGNWTGRYAQYVNEDDGNVRRIGKRVFLGKASEMTKEAARTKLDRLLEPANSAYEAELSESPIQLNLGEKGAIGEMIAAVDLMHKGFEVFRNLSPNGAADLVVVKNNTPYTVQVKRRFKMKNFGLPGLLRTLGSEFDVLALVDQVGKTKYFTNKGGFGIQEPMPQIIPAFPQRAKNKQIPQEIVGVESHGGSHPRTPCT